MILLSIDLSALDRITASNQAPGVVSMSLGGSTSTAQDDAVKNCVAAGYVVSVAAGNSNANACNYSPSRAPEVSTTRTHTHPVHPYPLQYTPKHITHKLLYLSPTNSLTSHNLPAESLN